MGEPESLVLARGASKEEILDTRVSNSRYVVIRVRLSTTAAGTVRDGVHSVLPDNLCFGMSRSGDASAFARLSPPEVAL